VLSTVLDDLVARHVVHHDAYDHNAAEGLDGMKRMIELKSAGLS
jgi:hypothetical protein